MKPVSIEELGKLVLRVKARLDKAEAAIGRYADDPAGYHARHHAEMDKVMADLAESCGAAFTNRWDNHSVRLAGIRSSSTSGIHGALHNWLNAAVKRIEKERGA